MLSALLIASGCFAFALGQTTNCINAYNETFGGSPSDDGMCFGSLYSLTTGSSGPDSAEATAVCQEGQNCNTRLNSINSACGDTVSYIYLFSYSN